MKKTFTVFTCFLLLSNLHAQWSLVDNFSINYSDNLNYLGNSKIWHYSFLSRTLKEYSNNFEFVKEIDLIGNKISEIKQIYLFGSDTIFIGCTKSVGTTKRNIVSSFDGGITFKTDYVFNNLDSFPNGCSVFFFNSRQGFVLASGNIYTTSDAGFTWELQNKFNSNYKYANNRTPSPLTEDMRKNGTAIDIRISGAPSYDSTFLIYTNDYGKNWFDKLLPKRDFSNGANKNGASMIFYNELVTPFVGYTNDSGNTIVRDTFIDIITSINYLELENGDGFYVVCTPSGTYINTNADKNWTKLDQMNFNKVFFSNRKNGFAVENGSNLNDLKLFKYSGEFNIGLLENIAIPNTISVFPNPAKSILNIDVEQGILEKATSMKVVSVNGQIFNLHGINKTIDISSLKQGVYCLIINSEKGVYKINFVKE